MRNKLGQFVRTQEIDPGATAVTAFTAARARRAEMSGQAAHKVAQVVRLQTKRGALLERAGRSAPLSSDVLEAAEHSIVAARRRADVAAAIAEAAARNADIAEVQ